MRPRSVCRAWRQRRPPSLASGGALLPEPANRSSGRAQPRGTPQGSKCRPTGWGTLSGVDGYSVGKMALDLEWDVPLGHRVGSAKRLAGIDLYYDFAWSDHFRDERAQFRNGQCLAKRIRASCPDAKTPVLLLTDRDHIEEGPRVTELHHVFVLNLPKYLQTPPDASLSYWADHLGPGITEINHLPNVSDKATEQQVTELVQPRLSVHHIAAWVSGNQDRIHQIRELVQAERPDPPATLPEIVAAIQALGELDADAVAAFARLIGPGANREHRLEFVRRLTEDAIGRYLTLQVLAERTAERVADSRQVIADYRALLEDPRSIETTMQTFIEANPWLLGLEYVAIRARQQILQGATDFLLERIDGFHDVLELKNPQDPIIKIRRAADTGNSPSPSEYSLSTALAQALAQVHVYRTLLTTYPDATADIFGLQGTRDPRLVIVIGKVERLGERTKRVLTELNKSLHRVEVVPYDVLAGRAEAVLDNVEKYLVPGE